MMAFLLGKARWMLVLSILAGVVAGMGGVGLVAIINRVLDHEGTPLAVPALWFIALCALLLLSRAASAILMMRLGQHIIFDLRLELSHRVLSAPLARLQELGSARILACLTQDIATLAEAFQWLPLLCVNAAVVAGCLAYLGWLSWPLLVLVVITMWVGIASFRLVEDRALRDLDQAREYDDALYGHLRSLTQGIKELKLHGPRRAAFVKECLGATAGHYRQHYVAGMDTYILATNWGNGLFYGVIGVLLFALPELGKLAALCLDRLDIAHPPLRVDGAMDTAILRGYCLTLLYMMSPLTVAVESLPILGRAGIALNKIRALDHASALAGEVSAAASAPFAAPPLLEFRAVTHRFHSEGDERCFLLGPLNLSLKPGELVFLVGGNGSGKTTLALLLVGLYAPESGEIHLDGRRVDETERETYRQQFSAVFADFYLFDSLLGFQDRELDAEARAYLAHLRLDHKVRIEDGMLSTLNLSQGQRKRLALLVAYLEDRPFYVFDEWAADQDPIFKKIFYTDILPALRARGKTVVVITHDDAYFHLADRCLKLEEGQLREMTPVPVHPNPEVFRGIPSLTDAEPRP